MPLRGHLLCFADRTETRPSFLVFTFSPLDNALTPVSYNVLLFNKGKYCQNRLSKTETQSETRFRFRFRLDYYVVAT
jgi:hypothetical protein